MNIVKLSISRPITVFMLFLLLIITGTISFFRLPLEFLPDIGYPQLSVITIYDNASPQEIEQLVTQPIEEVVSVLKNVKEVSSVSRENVSLVTIKYNWGTDMAFASLDLREKLDNIRYLLPDETERPNIARFDPTEEPVMYISLSSDRTEDVVMIQNLGENLIKRRLQQLEGVASADIFGDLEPQIEIILMPDRIQTLGLSLETIESKIKFSNFNIPGGTIRDGHYRYNINIAGEFQDVEEIGLTPIVYLEDGGVVLLRDIARIQYSYKEDKTISRMNGHRSLGILVRKEADANTVRVCANVREVLDQLAVEFDFIRFSIPVDQSVFIKQSIWSVLEAIFIGGLLAFIVLFLFLSDLRSPVNIAVVIPIAIFTTFILMFFNRISLNIISLSGLALGVGMLVDNSIVVWENIYRHWRQGMSRRDAALKGAKEVSLAITASTLTTLAVFLPILYVKGIASSLFKQQALTVTFSLLSSLFVSLTLLPLLFSLIKDRKRKKKKVLGKPAKILRKIFRIVFYPVILIYKFLDYILKKIIILLEYLSSRFRKMLERFTVGYQALLDKSLVNRGKTLLIFLAVFVVCILLLAGLDREFFPEIDQSEFTIYLKLEPGTTLENTDETVKLIESRMQQDKRIRSFFTSVGKSYEDKLAYYLEDAVSRNLAEIKVSIHHHFKTMKVIDDYRRILSDYALTFTFKKGDNILVSLLEFEEPGLSVIIKGNDLDRMKDYAQTVQDEIEAEDIFYNVRGDFDTVNPQISVKLNRGALALYNVSVERLSKFIRANISGEKISEFREFDNKIDIVVRTDEEFNLPQLLDQNFITDNGSIPLRLLLDARYSENFGEIKRRDQQRFFSISTLYNSSLKKAVKELERIVDRIPQNDPEINEEVSGVNREIAGSLRSLVYALLFAIILVYMILASQFESLKLPFIIMFVAPMGVIGVGIALLLSGTSISVMSTIGMIILSGIIVNDAILLVDYTNRLRKSGVAVVEAVKKAAATRLRPILMTTFTTVLGLLPLAIGIGSGAELQSAMAIAVIGGMLSATFLTLILIPVLYTLLEK